MLSQLEEYTKSGVLTRASPLVGEYCPHNLQDGFIVEERIKTLVKSLARDLNFHHEQGHCISSFNRRNIEINGSGHGQITGVKPTAKTEANIKKNYYLDLHDLIVKTIFRNFSYQQQVPPEWRTLLLLMKRSCIRNEYLICNNVALIPLQIRMLFFFLCYEHVMFSLRTDEEKQDRILSKLPYLKNWPDLLRGNYLLEESFAHKKHDVTTPKGFFIYYRDTNGHLMDRCHLLEAVGAYTGKEFEKNLLVRYPLYLFILQEELHKEGELEALEPHVLF